MALLWYGSNTSPLVYQSEQQLNNAGNVNTILREFITDGTPTWSRQAVSAVIGVMTLVSGINPKLYGGPNNTGNFGLLQWEPAYLESIVGANWRTEYDSQPVVVEYERQTNTHWTTVGEYQYDITFREFPYLTSHPGYLADVFWANYFPEKYYPQPQASRYAEYWCSHIYHINYPPWYPDDPSRRDTLPIILASRKRRWSRGRSIFL